MGLDRVEHVNIPRHRSLLVAIEAEPIGIDQLSAPASGGICSVGVVDRSWRLCPQHPFYACSQPCAIKQGHYPSPEPDRNRLSDSIRCGCRNRYSHDNNLRLCCSCRQTTSCLRVAGDDCLCGTNSILKVLSIWSAAGIPKGCHSPDEYALASTPLMRNARAFGSKPSRHRLLFRAL